MASLNLQLVDVVRHVKPASVSDRSAFGFTKLLSAVADAFFAKCYGHRAMVLETVAAVPGMVGASMTHLRCLRRMCDDQGWIRILMEEAENERMHLMTFIEVAQPSAFERFLIIAVQLGFYIGFLGLTWSARRRHTALSATSRKRRSSATASIWPKLTPAIARHY